MAQLRLVSNHLPNMRNLCTYKHIKIERYGFCAQHNARLLYSHQMLNYLSDCIRGLYGFKA